MDTSPKSVQLLDSVHDVVSTSVQKERIIEVSHDLNQQNILKDVTYALETCRRYLKVLGVWLHIDAGTFTLHNLLANIAVIICYYSIGIRGIPIVFYLILDEKRPIEKLRLMIRIMFVIMGWYKYFALRNYRREISECLKHIELDWLNLECKASRDIMMEQARLGHVIIRICAAFTYAGAFFLTLVLPLVMKNLASKAQRDLNVTTTITVKKFPTPSHFGHPIFFKTPIYEFVYWSQVIATFILHSIAIACYSVAVVIVMHACGQLKIMMGKLRELVDGGGEMSIHRSVEGRLGDIIEQHERVLSFVSNAEKMLRGIVLVDLGGCTFQLCTLGYFTLLEVLAEHKSPIAICAWFFPFCTISFNIFLFCYIGELLTQECVRVGEVSYLIDWYRLPGKKSLDLSRIIAMAHCPTTLTAGGAVPLSMICFGSIHKTALGYLNMIRTVMD